jgi:type II secretory pathway component GspD/PulD (secretin)
MRHNSHHAGSLLGVIICWLALLCGQAARGQAYCTTQDVQVSALANGVQISVKADGILNWKWEAGSEPAGWGQELGEVSIRFQNVRMGDIKTQYDVDQDPVSNITFLTPQDVKDGLGVVMRVTMTSPSAVEATLSEDRQTFLLTVKSKNTVERINRAATGAVVPATGGVDVSSHDGLISVHATKVDIQKVVAEIARQGDINVTVDDAVRHEVSLNLFDRKPLEVIKSIAAGYGLALSSVGDVYMLSEGVPADISSYQRSGTMSFPMRYLKAKDARTLLPNFLVKYVHDNPEQNTVVVTAPTQMLEKIGENLRAIDQPPPMIMVECAVVEIEHSSNHETNFSWLYQDKTHSFGTNTTTGDVNYLKQAQSLDATTGLPSVIVPTPQLQATLQALITQNRAEVDEHPSMAAINGKYAEIFIGSQRFINVTTTVNGVEQQQLETVPVGVRLKVTPWTGGNGEITTWVEVEVSTIAQIDPQTGIPLLETRRASTTMRTRDGETIIIGGLSQRQDDATKQHVPLLGKLPLIGSLFRGNTANSNNTELVLLIRPRLLGESGELPSGEDATIRTTFLKVGDLGATGDGAAAQPLTASSGTSKIRVQ